MWKKGSVGRRLIIIYFLLVFIALTIVGVFIMQQLEAYHMENTRSSLTKVAEEGVLKSLSAYYSLDEFQSDIQTNIETWYSAVQEEIFVVDPKMKIIAASNTNFVGESAVGSLDEALITRALSGETAESDGVSGNQSIRVKNMTFPIVNYEGNTTGVLYMRTDLTEIYDTLGQSMKIFLQAMLVALIVTVFLGVLISRSITRPINQLTRSTEAMSRGDFKEMVKVQSDDEIGRLGAAFNQMAEQLDKTMVEISDEKNKLELVLKTMADGLIAVDYSGRIIQINSAALDMLELTEEYALNRSYDPLIRGICPALTLGSLRAQTLEMDGANLSGNESFEHNGKVYFARYETLDRTRSSEVNLVVVLQDITERQKLESMQKDFVANVSHELNTPLTTIKSYTETMLDSRDVLEQEDLVRQFLTVIDSEADRMSRLVKDLLQLSRLESQRETWHKSVQNVTDIVESVIRKNQINARNKNQQLNSLFDPAADLPAYVDPDKIEQVLLNILSNAVKYTEAGGRIDVDALKRGDYIYISVRDNGIGIAEKEMSRLFERFYRVDKARSRSMGSGTGLGLSIAKQIVEEHEGTINIESKEGKGTTVTIRLPLYRG